MMLLAFLMSAVVATTTQDHKTNYQRVITHPDPANGYEDYLRASDVLNSPDFGLYLSWTPKQYDELLAQKKDAGSHDPEWTPPSDASLALAKQLRELDYLGVMRMAASRFGSALALVQAGNSKRVWDPRAKLDAEALFPEYAGFKNVAKFITLDAYVRFADGDTRAGTSELLDGLTFSRRIGGSCLIAELVSIACQSIALASFERSLTQLSEADAVQIEKYADAALAEPNTYVPSLQRERDAALANMDLMLASPANFIGDSGSGAQSEAFTKYVKGMSPHERETLRSNVAQTLNDTFNRIIGRFGADESTWADKHPEDLPPEPTSVASAQAVADVFIAILFPVYDQATVAVVRARTQLRLLGLDARIIEFKWHNHRLPSELKEAIPASLLNDPMGKTAFQYELRDGGYKLYSKGLPSTGPIELRYRRPPNLPTGDDGPIPPVAARRSLAVPGRVPRLTE